MLLKSLSMHFLKKSSLLSVFFIAHLANSQHLNFGLMKPQAGDQLPVSKTKTVFPKIKSQTPQATVLTPSTDGEFIFSQGWKLSDATAVTSEGQNIFDSHY